MDVGLRHRPPSRPRAHSYHPRSSSALDQKLSLVSFPYGSSLLESLDIPGSVWTLRRYLVGKLEEAEEGVRMLKEYLDESSSEEANSDEEGDDVNGNGGEDLDSDDDLASDSPDLAVETDLLSSTAPPTRRRSRRTHRRSSHNDPGEDLSALAQFIQTTSGFLAALRAELPSLSSSETLPSPLQFHLSPDAQLALDHFLEDHPLPSLSSFPTSLSASSAQLLARVTSSLSSLQDLICLPPSPPTSQSMTEYFKTEAVNLGRGIKQEAKLIVEKSSHALDEAARMYNAAKEGGRKRLLRYEELPFEWRNNEHILSGYRFIGIESWGALLRSGFGWHNETINIQSHFLGSLFLLYLLYALPSTAHYLPGSTWSDTAIAVLFLLAGFKCMILSACWHLFSGCATLHLHQGAACVDYVGISGLIAASVMGAEYYGFYCRRELAASYMVFTATLGGLGMVLPFKPWFNERKFKNVRIMFFVSLAASAIVPVLHMMAINSIRSTLVFFLPVIPSVLAYVCGLLFYGTQFPECTSPGRWDNVFASHQLWHIAILVAVWSHWKAMECWATAASQGAALSCPAL